MKKIVIIVLAMVSLARAEEIQDLSYTLHPPGATKPIHSSHWMYGSPINHGVLEIGIEHAPSFGPTPVFCMRIAADGTVRYVGTTNSPRAGKWTGKLPVWMFHRVSNFIVSSGYMEMADEYRVSATDGPTVYTLIRTKERTKVFRNYWSSAPSKLWALERLLESLIPTCDWTGATNAVPTATTTSKEER